MFLALVFKKIVPADADLVQNVAAYLQRAVEAANFLLPKDAAAVGASFTGDDDSDVIEE